MQPERRHVHYGIGGPIFLILLGVMFLLNEFVSWLRIDRTWPVVLIVAGLLLLRRSIARPRPPRGPQV